MHSRVHKEPKAIHFHEPGGGSDVRIWVKINNSHAKVAPFPMRKSVKNGRFQASPRLLKPLKNKGKH
jgi:hypothetical protein